MKTVIVEVDVTGAVKIEGQGFKGVGCKKATEAFERALGKCTKSTPKPEMYQHDSTVKVIA